MRLPAWILAVVLVALLSACATDPNVGLEFDRHSGTYYQVRYAYYRCADVTLRPGYTPACEVR